jgi:hypothetical protein
VKRVPLTRGMFAIVDDEDFDFISKWKWRASGGNRGHFYAARVERTQDGLHIKAVNMHRVINNTPDGLVTDHINGNTLDNRRENLRASTFTQNSYNCPRSKNNRSGYKGVSWDKNTNKWRAQMVVQGKKICLGYFANPKDASIVYENRAAIEHGDFYRPDAAMRSAQPEGKAK